MTYPNKSLGQPVRPHESYVAGVVKAAFVPKLSDRLTARRECDAEIAVAARQLPSMASDWALKFPKWEAATVPEGHVKIIGNANGNGDYISAHITSKPYTTSIDSAASLYLDRPAMIPSDPLECCRAALKQRGL